MKNHFTTKQFLYDGFVIYYTDEALNSTTENIGFYFNRLGFPQRVHRDSRYGLHIKDAILNPKRRPMTPMERVGYMAYHPHEISRARDFEADDWRECPNISDPWEFAEHAPIDERGNVIGEWMKFEIEE